MGPGPRLCTKRTRPAHALHALAALAQPLLLSPPHPPSPPFLSTPSASAPQCCPSPTIPQKFELLEPNSGALVKEVDFGSHYFGEVLHRTFTLFNNGPIDAKFLITCVPHAALCVTDGGHAAERAAPMPAQPSC